MIVVTGGKGMLGKSLQKVLPNAMYIDRKDVDLRDSVCVKGFFKKYKNIEYVIHLAAKVGGIQDNSSKQYDYFYINSIINTNVINECVVNNIPILAMSSSCVYPKSSSMYPMTENYVFSGNVEDTNEAYAYSKRMMGMQLRHANKQYGYEYTIIYSSNLYGPHDCFDIKKSHLVPSLINKIYNAKISNKKYIYLLGTGKPLRQFTYVDDLSKMIVIIINLGLRGEYNFSTSENISVNNISKIMCKVLKYKGKLIFSGDLDGVFRKDISCNKLLSEVGLFDFTPLAEGVDKTYKWYRSNL